MNAMNLIDGLDGLACGITFIASSVLMFVGMHLGNYENIFLLGILAASCLGFLPFNFHPAKIFMGDSGSMFLGMVLASMALIGSQHKTATAVVLLPPLTALALPVYDTFMAIIRRASKRRSVFRADSKHIHHRLLDLGLNQRQIVVFCYLITIYLSVFSFLFVLIPRQYAFALLMLLGLGICMGIVVVDFIERKLQAVIRLEGRRKKT
jgi:UDP-GlcNAc:undecaprenyl-phosphate GlcNAc-1-phosphate transferase